MIVLDTSILIDTLTGRRPLADALDRVLESDERMLVPTPVLHEWLRGPRREGELGVQRLLFPDERAIVFGPAEARMAPTCIEPSSVPGAGKWTSPSPRAPSPRRAGSGRSTNGTSPTSPASCSSTWRTHSHNLPEQLREVEPGRGEEGASARWSYDEESALAGSVLAASRAGIQQARIATPSIPAAAAPNVAASVPVTPQR